MTPRPTSLNRSTTTGTSKSAGRSSTRGSPAGTGCMTRARRRQGRVQLFQPALQNQWALGTPLVDGFPMVRQRERERERERTLVPFDGIVKGPTVKQHVSGSQSHGPLAWLLVSLNASQEGVHHFEGLLFKTRGLAQPGGRSLFTFLDRDANGTIDADEMMNALMLLSEYESKTNANHSLAEPWPKKSIFLGYLPPAILLSRKPPETWEKSLFLKRTMVEKNGESTPRILRQTHMNAHMSLPSQNLGRLLDGLVRPTNRSRHLGAEWGVWKYDTSPIPFVFVLGLERLEVPTIFRGPI